MNIESLRQNREDRRRQRDPEHAQRQLVYVLRIAQHGRSDPHAVHRHHDVRDQIVREAVDLHHGQTQHHRRHEPDDPRDPCIAPVQSQRGYEPHATQRRQHQQELRDPSAQHGQRHRHHCRAIAEPHAARRDPRGDDDRHVQQHRGESGRAEPTQHIQHAAQQRGHADQDHVGQERDREIEGVVGSPPPGDDQPDLGNHHERGQQSDEHGHDAAHQAPGRDRSVVAQHVRQDRDHGQRQRALTEQTPGEVRDHEGDPKRGDGRSGAEQVAEYRFPRETQNAGQEREGGDEPDG
jgi:hypothetical protein